MTITKALMYARLSSSSGTGTGLYRRARLGATRLNYFGPKLLLSVGSTLRTKNFDRTNWSVTQRGRGQAATLTIEVFGFTPTEGQEIVLGAGAITNRLFRGKITRVRQVRGRLNEGRTIFSCSCLDWTYDLGSRRVTKKYTNMSGTAIAQDLIATYAPAGFTSTHVQVGLDVLDEIQFTMVSLPSAIEQLTQRLGAYNYLDEDKDLHLFTSEPGSGPRTLDHDNRHIKDLSYEVDIEGLRNRILVEGLGTSVTAPVEPGATSIPVADTASFATSGTNYAKLEAQLVSYTGVASQEGDGCVTGGTAGSAPSALSGFQASGGTPGTFVGGNLTQGTYTYYVTFVSALGEGSASPAFLVAISPVTGNGGNPGFVSQTTGGSLTLLGAYYYWVTFETAAGEVGTRVEGINLLILTGSNNAVNLSGIAVSGDARVTKRHIYRTASGGGALKRVTTINDNSTTTYTDTTADAGLGATLPSSDALQKGQMSLSSIAIGAVGTTARKVYRTAVGGGAAKLLTTLGDNTTQTYTDNTADGSLGATLGTPTIGAAAGDTTLSVTDLSLFPSSGWVRVGSQVLSYTGRAASTGEGNLTGIPASGVGAIAATIPAGSSITVEPHLTGVPASASFSLANALHVGESINILVISEDGPSQGTYDVREDFIQDRRLSLDGCAERGAAVLSLVKDPRVSGTVQTTDPMFRAGKPWTINISEWGLSVTVTVQTVTIKPSPDYVQPVISAQYASRSLEDLFSQLRTIRERLAQ